MNAELLDRGIDGLRGFDKIFMAIYTICQALLVQDVMVEVGGVVWQAQTSTERDGACGGGACDFDGCALLSLLAEPEYKSVLTLLQRTDTLYRG